MFGLKCLSFKSKEPDKKFSTRVELIKLSPRIKESLEVRYLSCFTLENTLKDDPKELIQCFAWMVFQLTKAEG